MQISPTEGVREPGTGGDILVAVRGRHGDGDIITFRQGLSDGNQTRWHVVHVETASGVDRGDPAMVAEALGLAASLGASVATIPAATVADGLILHLANFCPTILSING